MKFSVRVYFVLRWLSQGINVLNAVLFWDAEDLLLLKYPEKITFSAYTGYKANIFNIGAFKRWEKVINFIFFWQPQHCYKAYLNESDVLMDGISSKEILERIRK